ncbi:MAG: hypothetical protein NW241_20600 [Bacteroidia bacterium]|nr:hypothetical protein [Bacteroidia bacterium]
MYPLPPGDLIPSPAYDAESVKFHFKKAHIYKSDKSIKYLPMLTRYLIDKIPENQLEDRIFREMINNHESARELLSKVNSNRLEFPAFIKQARDIMFDQTYPLTQEQQDFLLSILVELNIDGSSLHDHVLNLNCQLSEYTNQIQKYFAFITSAPFSNSKNKAKFLGYSLQEVHIKNLNDNKKHLLLEKIINSAKYYYDCYIAELKTSSSIDKYHELQDVIENITSNFSETQLHSISSFYTHIQETTRSGSVQRTVSGVELSFRPRGAGSSAQM